MAIVEYQPVIIMEAFPLGECKLKLRNYNYIPGLNTLSLERSFLPVRYDFDINRLQVLGGNIRELEDLREIPNGSFAHGLFFSYFDVFPIEFLKPLVPKFGRTPNCDQVNEDIMRIMDEALPVGYPKVITEDNFLRYLPSEAGHSDQNVRNLPLYPLVLPRRVRGQGLNRHVYTGGWTKNSLKLFIKRYRPDLRYLDKLRLQEMLCIAKLLMDINESRTGPEAAEGLARHLMNVRYNAFRLPLTKPFISLVNFFVIKNAPRLSEDTLRQIREFLEEAQEEIVTMQRRELAQRREPARRKGFQRKESEMQREERQRRIRQFREDIQRRERQRGQRKDESASFEGNLQTIRERFGDDVFELVRHLASETDTMGDLEKIIDEIVIEMNERRPGTTRDNLRERLEELFREKEVSPREGSRYKCRNPRTFSDNNVIYLVPDDDLVVDNEDYCYKFDELRHYYDSSIEDSSRFKSPYTNLLFSQMRPKYIGGRRFNMRSMFQGMR